MHGKDRMTQVERHQDDSIDSHRITSFVQDVITAVAEHARMSLEDAASFVHNCTPLDANLEYEPAITMHWSPRDTALEFLELFGPVPS